MAVGGRARIRHGVGARPFAFSVRPVRSGPMVRFDAVDQGGRQVPEHLVLGFDTEQKIREMLASRCGIAFQIADGRGDAVRAGPIGGWLDQTREILEQSRDVLEERAGCLCSIRN